MFMLDILIAILISSKAFASPALPAGTQVTALRNGDNSRMYGKIVNSFADGSYEVKVNGFEGTARWSGPSVLWEVPFLEVDGITLRKSTRVSGVNKDGVGLVGAIAFLWNDGSANIRWDSIPDAL